MHLPMLKQSLVALCGVVSIANFNAIARAEGPVGVQQQQQQRYAAPPPATLQVTGTQTRLSISANRADVQDVLKLIFDQVDRQFTLDSNVTGQVTIRLSGQPLNIVLNSICAQTFLRYRIELKTGIFIFERDVEKVKEAVSRLRALNAIAREQLRGMGLDMPADYSLINNGAFGGGIGGGGTGGGVPSNMPIAPRSGYRNIPDSRVLKGDSALESSQQPPAPGGASRAGNRYEKTGVPNKRAADGQSRRPTGEQGPPGPEGPDAKNNQLLYSEPYQQFLRDNNYVGINTQGQRVPVTEVLDQLARQANVPLIVDPSVPQGDKFSINANISPRPFQDTLNLLAPPARLEWRWVGNSVLITTTPEFQLFWGEAETPRVTYPAPKEQRGRTAPQDELQKKPATGEKGADASRSDPAKQKPEEKPNPNKKKG
jgi:hypothetical protein